MSQYSASNGPNTKSSLLAQRLKALKAPAVTQKAISPDPEGRYEAFPLNDMQQAYWLGRDAFFEGGSVGIHGYFELDVLNLDLLRFERAWNALIARHDMLRAVISEDGMQRVLTVEETGPYKIEISDQTGRDEDQALAATREALSHERHDLMQWPQFTIRASTGPKSGKSRLHFSIDGWSLDGWSYQVLFADLRAFYEGRESELPDLELSFRDCVMAKIATENDADWQADWLYWNKQLDTMPPAPQPPAMHTTKADKTPKFERESARLNKREWTALKTQAEARQLSTAALFLAAYAAVIERWSDCSAFTLNVPRFNRKDLHPQMERIVGQFSAFTFLPLDLGGLTHFEEIAEHARVRLWSALEHNQVSGVELLRELTRRSGGERVMMPVVFTTAPERRVGGEARTPVDELSAIGEVVFSITQTPQVHLDSQYIEDSDGVLLFWDHLEGAYPTGMVADMFGAYVTLLKSLSEDKSNWTAPLDLIPASQAKVRDAVNDTVTERAFTAPITRIAAQVDATPEAAAVIQDGDAKSYKELWARVGDIVAAIRAQETDIDAPIAVAASKGVDQVAAVLACQALGHPYVPIDVSLPSDRLNHIVSDSGAFILLAEAAVLAPVIDGVTVLRLQDCPAGGPAFEPLRIGQEDLFNITYTSGSTGTPKGVMVTQAGIANALEYTIARFDINGSDRTLSLTPFHHDMAVFDIFAMLMVGGTVVMPDTEQSAYDPAKWSEIITRDKVTIWNSVPAFMSALQRELSSATGALSRLRLVFMGGDWIPLETIAGLRATSKAAIVSVGGPTETTLWNIMHEVSDLPDDAPSVPYGCPIDNTVYHILDEHMRPCPDWVPGEMYCEGIGLARGYVGLRDATAEKFIEHGTPARRLYRTGDLGCYLPNGTIRFLGRSDDMLNVNGLRIEPAEVERQLETHDLVSRAVVVGQGDDMAQSLHAFVKAEKVSPLWTPQAGTGPNGAAGWAQFVQAGDAEACEIETYSRASLEETSEKIADLHSRACCVAFRKSGLFETKGVTHDLSDIRASLCLKPRYHKWLNRALTGLVSDGYLESTDATQFRAIRTLPHELPEDLFDDLRNRISGTFGFTVDQVDLLLAAARHLAEMLREEKHSAELYASEEVPGVYARNFGSCNQILAKGFEAALKDLPNDTELNVLEVGAGIGITTEFLMPSLPPERTRYVYTDLSDYFLNYGAQKFAYMPKFETQIYDLMDDPFTCGFKPGEFDIVVASGVLHDTRNLRRTLQNMRKVMKPGGWMVIILPTKMLRLFDLSMGLQTGFDVFDDLDLRQAHPLLPGREWVDLFKAEGYADCHLFEAPDSLADFMGFSALIAKAGATVPAFQAEPLRQHLRQALPAAMVPQLITPVDDIPLTANGKVDRRRMREATTTRARVSEHQPPETPLQQLIAEVWLDVLPIKAVGIRDNFFALGGDSLVATQVLSRIKDKFGLEFSMGDLFTDPTLKGMEDVIAIRLSMAVLQDA